MPSAVNYSHPEKYGIRGTRNFHIKTNDNMTLGVWYVTSHLFRYIKLNLVQFFFFIILFMFYIY